MYRPGVPSRVLARGVPSRCAFCREASSSTRYVHPVLAPYFSVQPVLSLNVLSRRTFRVCLIRALGVPSWCTVQVCLLPSPRDLEAHGSATGRVDLSSRGSRHRAGLEVRPQATSCAAWAEAENVAGRPRLSGSLTSRGPDWRVTLHSEGAHGMPRTSLAGCQIPLGQRHLG